MHKAKLEISIWTDESGSLPDDLAEALAPHAQRIAKMLEDGFVAGEVCDERFRGWWNIELTP